MRIHFILNDDFLLQNLMSELSKTDIITSKNNEITTSIDLVVVGKNISENHPDLLKTNNLGLKNISFSEFIYEYFKNKTRVVIAGNDGKAHIIKMILHTMSFHNIPIDYWQESILSEKRLHIAENAEFVVIEGNEKNFSPLFPTPAFHSYHPTVALIGNISTNENLDKYSTFIDSITKGGILIYNAEDTLLQEIVEDTTNPIRKLEYKTPHYQIDNQAIFLITNEGELPLENIDSQRVIDVEGAKWVCQNMGIDETDFYEAMVSF
ncbi:MAG: Mur ligase [Capnocytophaga sp.]|nr:Mur ligase [Capnocytophaga sp.]